MTRHPQPLPAALLERAALQVGLLRTRQLVAAGVGNGQIRRHADAGRLRLLLRGVYEVPGLLPPPRTVGESLDRERLRAAVLGVLAHGPTAVATGLAALALLGVKGTPRTIRPEVALRHGGPSAAAPGVRIRRSLVRSTMPRHGVDCVPPEVALAQAVTEVDRMTAVALMDSARSQGIVTARGLERARALTRGRRGAARRHGWWDECDSGSQSPAETWARLRCTDLGFPPDRLQLVVRRPDGRFLARVDLAWLLPDGRWLLGEIDGIDWHSGRRDVLADLSRQNQIVTTGTLLRRWTGRQAADGTVAAEAAALLAGASWHPAAATPSELILG